MISLYVVFLIALFSSVRSQCSEVAVPLVTVNAPTFNQGLSLLSSDILTLGFDWGRTTTRSIAPVITTGTCLFPSLTNAFAEPNPCYLAYTMQTSFSALVTAPACGTSSASLGNPLTKTWKIPVTLSGNETFVDRRSNTQTRRLTYNLLIQLGYPDFVSAQVAITPFAAVLLDAFIISQIYSTTTKTATIIFNTVVGYPFMLTTSAQFVTNIPSSQIVITRTETSGFSANVTTSVPSTAATGPGQQSFQTWIMTITPPDTACTFTGDYNVSGFVISCIPGVQCPPINNNLVTLKLQINSENFCAQTSAVVGVSTSLAVYSDPLYSIPGGNFLVDDIPVQTAYFEMRVTSSAVIVRDLVINTIILSTTSGLNYLFASGTPTASVQIYNAGNWVSNIGGQILTNPSPGAARFRINIVSALFNIPRDSLGQVLVQVTSRVYYEGAKKKRSNLLTADKSEKRAEEDEDEDLFESEEVFSEFLFQTEGDQKEVYSVPLGLQGPKTKQTDAPLTDNMFSGMNLIFTIALAVMTLLVVGLVIGLIVAIVYKKKKNEKKEYSVQQSEIDCDDEGNLCLDASGSSSDSLDI